MSQPLNQMEFQAFVDLVLKESGIVLDEDKGYLVEARLESLLRKFSLNSYRELHDLCQKNPAVLRQIVDLMTTNETYWFSGQQVWKLIETKIIPSLFSALEKRSSGDKLRIGSFGCSSGQEPYSLAMALTEYAQRINRRYLLDAIEIYGYDLSTAMLEIAKNGVYDEFSMQRGLDGHRIQSFFKKISYGYEVKDEIRRMVQFTHHNLLNAFPSGVLYDFVMFRNVSIYFSIALKQKIFSGLGQAIRKDGYLLLGASESLLAFQTKFKIYSEEAVSYYQNMGS